MRYVLDNYLRDLGYDTLALDDYRDAQTHLRSQFDTFSSDKEFNCVLLGWQSGRNADAGRFLSMLESPDFQDLPAIVLSQETRADSRAWVAGRSQTTLLRWKDYKGVRERLTSMLDSSLANDEAARMVKFSNHDISILVVDDSASIRFALRDLLELHGYRVTVVSSHSEAMATARSRPFDIAVLDYYLQDSTGDDLCRELLSDAESGDITCAILTGTYSDHIIKSSLRAGAVECMFKNESGELLLARIDAISRMVRQRKSLLQNQRRLDAVIDHMSGATIILDSSHQIEFISQSAQRLLGFSGSSNAAGYANSGFGAATSSDSFIGESANETQMIAGNSLLGRSAVELIAPELPRHLQAQQDASAGIHEREAVFRDAQGRPFPVVYSYIELDTTDHAVTAGSNPSGAVEQPSSLRVMVFQATGALADGDQGLDAPMRENIPLLTDVVPSGISADGQVQKLGSPVQSSADSGISANAFSRRLQELLPLAAVQENEFNTSVLLVEFAFREGSQLKPVTASPERLRSLEAALQRAYPAEGEVAYFGSSRFGMLIRHRDMARALMQARKLLQACNQLGSDLGLDQMSSIGTLINLQNHSHKQPEEVLANLHRSLSKIAQHTRDMVLLVDHDKMMKIYPDSVAGQG